MIARDPSRMFGLHGLSERVLLVAGDRVVKMLENEKLTTAQHLLLCEEARAIATLADQIVNNEGVTIFQMHE